MIIDLFSYLCYYAFVRTTIDFPDAVFRKVKAAASLRGQSLKAYVTQAVERELGSGALPPQGRRITLPLVCSRTPGSVDLSSKRVAELLAEEDRGLPS